MLNLNLIINYCIQKNNSQWKHLFILLLVIYFSIYFIIIIIFFLIDPIHRRKNRYARAPTNNIIQYNVITNNMYVYGVPMYILICFIVYMQSSLGVQCLHRNIITCDSIICNAVTI